MNAVSNACLDKMGAGLELEERRDSEMDLETMRFEILRIDCSENHNCDSHRTNSGLFVRKGSKTVHNHILVDYLDHNFLNKAAKSSSRQSFSNFAGFRSIHSSQVKLFNRINLL